MAKESLIEDVFPKAESGEEFLRQEDEIADHEAWKERSEVVELPLNVQRLQAKQSRLQQEINVCQAQINELSNKMETAHLAFQQCVVLLQVEETTNGS